MDEQIIWEKFSEWTNGLNPQESRIAVFTHIRDIPYAIVPQLRDPVAGPTGILQLNKGSCQPKHYLLSKLFAKLDIPVKLATYPFYWKDLPLQYPAELKKIIPGLPAAYHLACKAYLNERWVLVDASYDPELKKAGFPVNENWDGSSDTYNGVVPQKEILHENAQGRLCYETEQKSRYSQEEKAAYAEFVDKFNLWLARVRNP